MENISFIPNYKEAGKKDNEKLTKEIKSLIDEWEIDVKYSSSLSEIVLHENYQIIIANGVKVIPILLNELRHNPNYWFDALKTLAKAHYNEDIDPVCEADRGDLQKMAQAWITWGENQDFI